MAQKVLVEMIDDISGDAATQTVPFGLDGVHYEIDLSDDNAANLREELARYVTAGRRTGGRKVRLATGESATRTSTPGADRARAQAIRTWAKENGFEVSERGRISADVVREYDQAQQKPAAPKPARGRRKRTAAK